MLKCPQCNVEFPDTSDKGKVRDSFFIFDKKLQHYNIRRRRLCSKCNKAWTTVEVNRVDLIKMRLDKG